ncbi:hypothetical protein GQ53DRAFT_820541 [Thozetella sp. PMI_491]|nr:hypothetical protein GQ53DRAFT_820541 [Thozetella sp. PMI_491]
MAATTSALSLSSFQSLTSSGVSISCIVVYNQAIQGCTPVDFTKGNSCSTACVNGLAKTEANIQVVCDGDGVSASSVLGHALLGDLVNLLCPSSGSSGASNPAATTQTNVVVTSTRAQSTSRTSATERTTLARGTTTLRQTTSTSGFTFPAQTSNVVPTTTLDTSTEASDSPEPTDTVVAPPPPATTEQQSDPVSPAPVQTAATQAPENSDTLGVGRGSPFDANIENASAHLTTTWHQASAVAFVLALVLLR